jgi:hypothetical protein
MKEVTQLPTAEEPAVRNPELARLVELARRQPTARLTVDADRVHAAWKEQRARRWRSVGLLVAAAVVGMVGTSLVRDLKREPAASMTATTTVRTPTRVESSERAPVEHERVELADLATPETVATGVRVEPRSEDAAHTVLGPWTVEVAAGVYEMAAPVEAVSSLHVRLGARTLVVEPGGMVRVEGGARPEAVLLSGEAAWVDRDGRRTPLAIDRGKTPRRMDASTLARKAERLMAAGDRKGAIAAYRTLVDEYPRSPAARAGLLDLARLLKATGDADGARCAYAKLLERWPNNHLRPEIERELRRLGPGPACPAK